MPYITLDDGCRLYYEMHGHNNGKTILLLHGFMGGVGSFSEQIPPLIKEGYRIIVFDAIGHGKSDKSREDYSIDRLKKDYKIISKELNLKNIPLCLVGHSAGGGVAQLFYHEYKNQVKALILISTSYSMIDSFPRRLIWLVLPDILPFLHKIFLPPAVKFLIRYLLPPIGSLIMKKEVNKVKRWIDEILALTPEIIKEELKEISRWNLKDKLKEIKVPTLIICGDFDLIVPSYFSNYMHKKIPNSQLYIVKGCGHTAVVTKSNEVNRCIINFLRKYYPAK